MTENYGQRKALGISIFLHLVIFLLAAALGLFSAAQPAGQRAPIDVVLYDAGGDTGSAAGDAPPAAAAASVPDDIVLQDKMLPQQAEQETKEQTSKSPTRASPTGASGSADRQGTEGSGTAASGTGSGAGTGTGDGDGGGGSGTLPSPPKERVEASLLSEAAPEYPQELIDDDVEGTVSIKILVAADGSVEDVSVASSSGYRAMDKAAVAAGWRFRFNPGDNGRRGIWTKTFRFHLN